MKHLLKILLLSFLPAIGLHLQAQTIADRLEQTTDLIRRHKYFEGTTPFLNDIKTDAGSRELINASALYFKDTIGNVRSFAAELIYFAGRNSKTLSIRQLAVQYLVIACNDKESGNSAKAGKYLEQYLKNDFNPVSKDSLVSIIKRGGHFPDNILMVAGYINLTSAIPYIKDVIANPKQNDKTRWAAHLALSRMGDKEETGYCVGVVKSKNMSDAIVYNLLPGLVYTRQKAAFDYLITILNSDEKNCISPNPDNPAQIVCGYRVMEFLAPVIKDFPLQTYKGIRQIKTKDYKAALQTARNWFKEHKDDYKITHDTF